MGSVVREARIPIDLAMENVGESIPTDWDDSVMEMRRWMEQAFQTVRDQLRQAFQRDKQVYDVCVKKASVQSGRLGLVLLPQKTASYRTEVATVSHGTVPNRESSQFRQQRDSAVGRT